MKGSVRRRLGRRKPALWWRVLDDIEVRRNDEVLLDALGKHTDKPQRGHQATRMSEAAPWKGAYINDGSSDRTRRAEMRLIEV